MARIQTALLVISVLTAAAYAKEPPDAADDDAFYDNFYSDTHMTECVAALDSLRGIAWADIYDKAVDQLGSDIPTVETSSGILLAYSIAQEEDSCRHCFSVSRTPYLATAFGKYLMGLASLRFGLPAPEKIGLSSRQVYHTTWILTREQHEALANSDGPAGEEPMMEIMADASVRTILSEIVPLEMEPERK